MLVSRSVGTLTGRTENAGSRKYVNGVEQDGDQSQSYSLVPCQQLHSWISVVRSRARVNLGFRNFLNLFIYLNLSTWGPRVPLEFYTNRKISRNWCLVKLADAPPPTTHRYVTVGSKTCACSYACELMSWETERLLSPWNKDVRWLPYFFVTTLQLKFKVSANRY